MTLEIQIQVWYSHKYVAELNRLIDGYAYINKQLKTIHIVLLIFVLPKTLKSCFPVILPDDCYCRIAHLSTFYFHVRSFNDRKD